MQEKKPWEIIAGYIKVDAKQAKDADGAFAVKGNSLAPFLCDGDYVLIQSTAQIGDSEIGAFWVDGRVRIMRMQEKGSTRKLLPLNPDYPKVEITDGVECIGRMVGRA